MVTINLFVKTIALVDSSIDYLCLVANCLPTCVKIVCRTFSHVYVLCRIFRHSEQCYYYYGQLLVFIEITVELVQPLTQLPHHNHSLIWDGIISFTNHFYCVKFFPDSCCSFIAYSYDLAKARRTTATHYWWWKRCKIITIIMKHTQFPLYWQSIQK